ncbi:hypothetical protein SS50377_27975 [Spironucleus salmonicida]|uniref:Uncharacterized protein n=1 Tax=Spironucleus salmonicida TaxID=348837 RepID=V6LE27_9EUKA|nr:hypothetical protein SS50377_27975 [Spironucleus salmonicida]|eukprot:EST42533.1 Hypothetical protein SS50377_17846 [Spironucleus salmonicida]
MTSQQQDEPSNMSEMEYVPVNYFRLPTYKYSQQAKDQNLLFQVGEEASDELIGYIQTPLLVKPISYDSEAYPRIHINQISEYKHPLPPIFILTKVEDIQELINATKIPIEPITGFATSTFASGHDVLFLPTGVAYKVAKGETKLPASVTQGHKPTTNQVKKEQDKPAEVQIPKIPVKYILLSIIIFALAIYFAFKQSESHIFSGDNKSLIQRASILEQLSLKANATDVEIRQQYKSLLIKYDISLNPTCQWCPARLEQVQAAYKQLNLEEVVIPTSWDKGTDGVVKGNFK